MSADRSRVPPHALESRQGSGRERRRKRRHSVDAMMMTTTMTTTMTTVTRTTVRARATRARGASAVTRVNAPRPCVESAMVDARAMARDDDEHTDCGRVDAAPREARVCDMAKAKCVHPARPVAKACGDCPRRK